MSTDMITLNNQLIMFKVSKHRRKIILGIVADMLQKRHGATGRIDDKNNYYHNVGDGYYSINTMSYLKEKEK